MTSECPPTHIDTLREAHAAETRALRQTLELADELATRAMTLSKQQGRMTIANTRVVEAVYAYRRKRQLTKGESA